MAQDTFLSAFEQIDTDRDGIIYVADLESYARRENVSPDFVQKWKMLFDPTGTGQITFEHFCTTLGVSKKNRDNALKRRQPDPQVYDCNMTEQTKTEALDVIKRNYNFQSPGSSIHPTLTELDEKLGPRWQGRELMQSEKPNLRGEYLVYSLDNKDNKYAIWRQPEPSKKSCACCCC